MQLSSFVFGKLLINFILRRCLLGVTTVGFFVWGFHKANDSATNGTNLTNQKVDDEG